MRPLAALLGTLLCVGATATAEAEIKLKLPPPELGGLVPFAALPLDKPAVALPPVAPPPLDALPDPPSARLVSDIAHRPVAAMPPARVLACNPVGTLFKVGSELVECGRARYQKGELEAARAAFQDAAQESNDRSVLREARYWLGETSLRLGRAQDAERALAAVPADDPRGEFAPFATSELGWIALERNDPARALTYFESLLKGRMPVLLIPYARHGRALALYGLKRYAEARDEWMALLAGANVPRPLIAEVNFWLGDTLGRLGDPKAAIARLQAFTGSGSRLLMENGLLSLGWWSRAAGRPDEAVRAYGSLLSSYPQATALGLWARAGLVQAFLDQGDYARARAEAKQLETADKQSPLVVPTLLALRRWAAEKSNVEEARALDADLLARALPPATRAWVLVLSAGQARQGGNPGEARDALELARAAEAPAAVRQQAAFRLAEIDFDARQFAQASSAAQALLGESLPDDLRAAVIILAAESAYWARQYDQAVSLYSRFLTEFPARPEAPPVGLALGWAEFRRGRLDAARQRWSAFAREAPADPRAAEALLLAAELAAKSGDATEARQLLDRVVGQYPGTEPADVATLNRAILALDAGRPEDALNELNRLGTRPSSSPYLGRARIAKGMAFLAGNRPTQAEAELKGALGQGDDALCHLGLGKIAFGRGQWDVAAREFTEARDAGGRTAAAADYGLAAVAFDQGKADEFKKLAGALLAGPADPATTPPLLHGMAALAAQDKQWADARTMATRLVDRFPRHSASAAALADVGSAAGESGEWALARDMYQTLAARYPSSPGRDAGRLVYAEALLRTGAAAEARRQLEALAAALKAGDPAGARLLPLLAEAQEATGDRPAATQTYARFATEYPGVKAVPTAALGAGRLLQADGKWSEARPMLERAVKEGDAAIAAEAAYRMGEGLRAAGQHDEAVEAYMTAAYAAPDSEWARRALLGAGRSFAALKQNDAAAIVYKKLLASAAVEPDLETAARSGLKSLGGN